MSPELEKLARELFWRAHHDLTVLGYVNGVRKLKHPATLDVHAEATRAITAYFHKLILTVERNR